MDIHINTVSQCTGEHRYFDLTINGGVERRLRINREDIALERDDIHEAVLGRIRSALKEAGVSLALAQWKTALEGKDFKV